MENAMQENIRTLSRMSFLTNFFITTIFFYIFQLLYGILAILFFKVRAKLRKPSKRHAWLAVEKFLISPLPTTLTENTENKSTQNLIYLIGVYFFVLLAVNFADISSACNSPRFNLVNVSDIPNSTASIKFYKNFNQYFFTDFWKKIPFL